MRGLDVLAGLVELADLEQAQLDQAHELDPARDRALVADRRRDRPEPPDQLAEGARDADELPADRDVHLALDPLSRPGHDPFVGDPVRLADRLDLVFVGLFRLFGAVRRQREGKHRDHRSEYPRQSLHLPRQHAA